jgi:xanthine dehydrogenase molybdenum-binding subunit
MNEGEIDLREVMMNRETLIGKDIPRIDSVDKALGRAKYAGDMVLPGMLYSRVLRSPHAHA